MGQGRESNEKVGNRIMSLMLIHCYGSITLTKGRELTKQINEGQLDETIKENKDLIGLEKWHKIFLDGNEDAIRIEMSSFQNAIRDLQENNLFEDFAGKGEASQAKQSQAQAGGQPQDNNDGMDEYKRQELLEKMQRERRNKGIGMEGMRMESSFWDINFNDFDPLTKNVLAVAFPLTLIPEIKADKKDMKKKKIIQKLNYNNDSKEDANYN